MKRLHPIWSNWGRVSKAKGKLVKKESVGVVKLDLRFREGKIDFIFLIIVTVYLMIIFGL